MYASDGITHQLIDAWDELVARLLRPLYPLIAKLPLERLIFPPHPSRDPSEDTQVVHNPRGHRRATGDRVRRAALGKPRAWAHLHEEEPGHEGDPRGVTGVSDDGVGAGGDELVVFGDGQVVREQPAEATVAQDAEASAQSKQQSSDDEERRDAQLGGRRRREDGDKHCGECGWDFVRHEDEDLACRERPNHYLCIGLVITK